MSGDEVFRGWRRTAVSAARALGHSYSEVLALPWDEVLLALDAAQAVEAEVSEGRGALVAALFGG